MNIDEAIYTILADALSSYCDTPLEQISPKPIAPGVEYPQVPFSLVDDPSRIDRPERWRRLRVWAKDDDFHTCVAMVDAIYGALSGGYGTVDDEFTFDRIECIDRGGDPQMNAETKKYEAYSDYRVCYH